MATEHHVYLQAPYFILDASIAEALRSAAMSGVDVKVMISARPSGNRWPDWAGNTYFGDLIDVGMRIFLYERNTCTPRQSVSTRRYARLAQLASIDIHSFSINYELNAVIYDERIAQELEQDFALDLADCTAFDQSEYKNRKLPVRFRDSIARLVSPLL